MVKKPPANAKDARDPGLIPGWGEDLWRRKNGNPPRILPGESPLTEEFNGPQSRGCRVRTRLKRSAHNHPHCALLWTSAGLELRLGIKGHSPNPYTWDMDRGVWAPVEGSGELGPLYQGQSEGDESLRGQNGGQRTAYRAGHSQFLLLLSSRFPGRGSS